MIVTLLFGKTSKIEFFSYTINVLVEASIKSIYLSQFW